MRISIGLVAVGLVIMAYCETCAQIPAFPGAEGFGAKSFGGRNGDVYIVTSLADTNSLGTLRHAVNTSPAAGRTIVFDTSGTITLGSTLNVSRSNITIAGQTAPGPGITIKGRTLRITGSNNIVRHLHVRLGQSGGAVDSLAVEGGNHNIVDHISGSWSGDEVISVADNANHVTIQWSFMNEALNYANHAYGSLIRPDNDAFVTQHHNLYAHNRSRNARLGSYNGSKLCLDFCNNVIYDWIDEVTYTGNDNEQEFVDINFVGNYGIAGPSTRSKASRLFFGGSASNTRVYESGNYSDSNKDSILNGVLAKPAAPYFVGLYSKADSEFRFDSARYPVTVTTASDAYRDVFLHGGAFFWNRDAIDERILSQVQDNSGSIIQTEDEVGGFVDVPVIVRDATWDTDNDGMPNEWESRHGLDPLNPSDFREDFDTDGYSNLEEYVNEVGAFPAPIPIVFQGKTGNRFAQINNWTPIWQPSRFDAIQVNSGTVIVDAIGQHAGTVTIGASANDTAGLEIRCGTLDVAERLTIGAHPDATGTLDLKGGTLRCPLLARGQHGTFNFTGGKLQVDIVNFDLQNNGGTVAPGLKTGELRINGDLTLAAGTLQIELESNSRSDAIAVDGTATLGGRLEVVLAEGFVPQPGNRWKIMAAKTLKGGFVSPPEGFSIRSQDGNLLLAYGPETMKPESTQSTTGDIDATIDDRANRK